MASILVKNVPGAIGDQCNCECETWSDHWQVNNTVPSPTQCSVVGCGSTDLIIAPVQKTFAWEDTYIYIVPICQACSEKTDKINIRDHNLLVIADKCLAPKRGDKGSFGFFGG